MMMMMATPQNIDGLVPNGDGSPDIDRMMEQDLDLDHMLAMSSSADGKKEEAFEAPSGLLHRPMRSLSFELQAALSATQPQLDHLVSTLGANGAGNFPSSSSSNHHSSSGSNSSNSFVQPLPAHITFAAPLVGEEFAAAPTAKQQQQQQQQYVSPLVDLGNDLMLFDELGLELELPAISHCTAHPYPGGGSISPTGSMAESSGSSSRGSSVEPSAAGAFDALEECLSSDDGEGGGGGNTGGYNSDSSGGESYHSFLKGPHGAGDAGGGSSGHTQLPSLHAQAHGSSKGGAVRRSSMRTAATTRWSSRTSKASKSNSNNTSPSPASPHSLNHISSNSMTTLQNAAAAASAAEVAAANKKPRKGWKCSCAFLVASITQRERQKLLKAGVVPPPLGTDPSTLSKTAERELRSALRKIRNVASAQKSRRNQKDYIAALEAEAAARDGEITTLEVEVQSLAGENKSLLSQLAGLRHLLSGGGKDASGMNGGTGTGTGTGTGGTALLMLAVCCGIAGMTDPSATAAAAAAAAGFGVGTGGSNGGADVGGKSIYIGDSDSSNMSGGGGGGGDYDDGLNSELMFAPTGFKSRTLMSVDDVDMDVESYNAISGIWSLWVCAVAAVALLIIIGALVTKFSATKATTATIATTAEPAEPAGAGTTRAGAGTTPTARKRVAATATATATAIDSAAPSSPSAATVAAVPATGMVGEEKGEEEEKKKSV